MKIEELNPFIRYAKLHMYIEDKKEVSVCYDCRLFYLLQGEGTLFLNGQNYALSESTVVFLPPKSRYRFTFTDYKNVKIYILNFDLTDKFHTATRSLGTATENTFTPSRGPDYTPPPEFCEALVQENGMLLRNSIAACVDAFLTKNAYYRHTASANLKLTLLQLLNEHRSEKSDYKLVQSVQDFIRSHYADAELDNYAIAKEFNYHPYHINRLMKKHTNKTLHDYLLDYRLHIAKNYLTTTALNVTEVAERTGFSSYTYFIKLFRERTGISPLQYRKTHENVGF